MSVNDPDIAHTRDLISCLLLTVTTAISWEHKRKVTTKMDNESIYKRNLRFGGWWCSCRGGDEVLRTEQLRAFQAKALARLQEEDEILLDRGTCQNVSTTHEAQAAVNQVIACRIRFTTCNHANSAIESFPGKYTA